MLAKLCFESSPLCGGVPALVDKGSERLLGGNLLESGQRGVLALCMGFGSKLRRSHLTTLRRIVALCALVLAPLAQSQSSEVRIDRVDFSKVEQAGARWDWLEVAVRLDVRRGAGGLGPQDRFTGPLRIVFDMAVEMRGKPDRRFSFFTVEAEVATLTVGEHVARFYLPPQLALKLGIGEEPFAWRVELSERGLRLSGSLSESLEESQALDSYIARLAREAPANDSVLMLQRETPFRDYSPETSVVTKPR